MDQLILHLIIKPGNNTYPKMSLLNSILSLLIILGSTSISCAQQNNEWMQSDGFVYLDEVLQDAQYDARYADSNNFTGRPVEGYLTQRLVMTKEAANALKNIESHFNELGYGIKIFDTYRHQIAVDNFKKWALDPSDTLTKSIFYPSLDKQHLFQLGYISSKSGHTRGSTIDMTLYHLDTGEEVDMGGPYDFFGDLSHHNYKHISLTQKRNRALLKTIMSQYGFRSYAKEWWHYTLRNEPYPNTYFNHIVRQE